jgi:peptide-methionine (S)-S-oxide reductase
MRPIFPILACVILAIALGCILAKGGDKVDLKNFPDPKEDLKVAPDAGPQTMVLAGGCFWCTEGVCELAPGVSDVVSGYAGGSAKDANYEAVSTGTTGHAEAIKITYDPARTSYGKILKQFFSIAHDPTQLNYQGPDRGTQYRSAIFYETDEQKRVAEAYIKQLNDAHVFSAPIVTKLEKLDKFYPAEEYHQKFVQRNPNHPYIQYQAMPKVEKAKKAAASATTKGS